MTTTPLPPHNVEAEKAVLGSLMIDPAAYADVGPILAPVVTSLGVEPLHFGFIMVLNLTIGLITPPLGACLFILRGISGLTLEKMTRAVVPFLVAEFIILFLCTYVPSISLFLPRIFGFL